MMNWAKSASLEVTSPCPGLWRVLHVSENANNGSNAGTFTFNGNNDSSNRNRNIGTHLAVRSAHLAALLQGRGEYDDPIRLGSESEQPGNQQR